MEANTGSSASPHWRVLYETAILELDACKLQQRITEAERAIMDRMEDLNRSGNNAESQTLINALNAMRDLRKMCYGDGRPQSYARAR